MIKLTKLMVMHPTPF